MIKQKAYARLNDNDICIGVMVRVDELKNVEGFIEIPEYSDTYLYRKWDGVQWSQELYEPEMDEKVEKQINELKAINKKQEQQIKDLSDAIAALYLGGM